MLFYLLAAGVALGFFLALFVESLTLFLRVAGAENGLNAYASYLILLFMLVNRVGASVMFPCSGALTDLGVSIKFVAMVFSLAIILTAAGLSLLILYRKAVVKLLSRIFPDEFPHRVISPENNHPTGIRLVMFSAFIFTFNLLGIVVPVMGAIWFNEYRASIIQTGFLFNSIGTIFNTIYLEKRVAICAERSPKMLLTVVNTIVWGKLLALLLFAGCLTIMLVF
ncbi:hypothetical protein P886_3027 [Alteromonadaceae bacterium 2753L.S.0a.02]|nr:hypothetical protein P886_3027 [Alteromonadaceae bacterium 2753L.S.0a.02]